MKTAAAAGVRIASQSGRDIQPETFKAINDDSQSLNIQRTQDEEEEEENLILETPKQLFSGCVLWHFMNGEKTFLWKVARLS